MCGKIPASYMIDPTDNRHGYYNFHTEVHYAITDHMNLYLCNIPDDYKKTAPQFTQQNYYFVVVHTTEQLLREMTTDLQMSTQRTDMTGWYARKDIDTVYQSKAGEVLGRLSGWTRSINVGKYMELRVVYKQQNRRIFEEKNVTQARQKPDDSNPPHQHRFFLFLVQHYSHRLQNIFQRAGATSDDYQRGLFNFDKRCVNHFTRPNRRTLQMIRTTQTTEEAQRDLQRISQLPEMQPTPQKDNIPTVPEESEIDENYDNLETRSTTRASGSTSLKRKSTEEAPDTKKQQAGTILNFYNATINTHTLHTSSM
eukprot:6425942-Amphidinium_carterae.1